MRVHKVTTRLHNSSDSGSVASSRHSFPGRVMVYIYALLFAAAAVFADDPCPRSNIHNFYRELGCEPVYENASKCPSSFVCPSLEGRNKGHCMYKGRTYAIGEFAAVHDSDPCSMSCVCVQNGDDVALFSCAIVECPEFWRGPLNENCVYLYTADKCCSTGTFCPNATSKPTCEYEGKTYYEGERFYPENDSCKRCYCKPGFAGKLEEPFCEDISCAVEGRDARLYRNCVPVYYGKDGCCPISWKCPVPTLTPRITPSGGNATTTAKCKFGQLELNQFDVLEEDGVKCECLAPPYLSCFEGNH